MSAAGQAWRAGSRDSRGVARSRLWLAGSRLRTAGSRLSTAWARLLGRGVDADPLRALAIDAEIENHLLERIERLVDEGVPPVAARREAVRRFGNVAEVRRSLARIGGADGGSGRPGGELFASVLRDLRQGVRMIRTAPGFAAAVILTIALGVGANAAVFSVTDAVLLRPLPYEAPAELVAIQTYYPEDDRSSDRMPRERALELRRRMSELDLTLYAHSPYVLTGGEQAVSVPATAVTPDWLATLGVTPALGRGFAPDEADPGNGAVVVVSHQFWQQHLGGDRDAVGRTVELNRRRFTVIGVMDTDFKFPPTGRDTAWVPMARDGNAEGVALDGLRLLARHPEGADSPALQEVLGALGAGLREADPEGPGWELRPVAFDRFRANPDVEQALWVLTGAVVVMLLIATVNAANLLLLRATTRRSEVAVRMALGASRARLVRQHVTEHLLLVAAGGVAAIALARSVLGSIVSLLPSEVTFFLTSRVAVNDRVLLFSLAVTVVTGLALSLVPALRAGGAAREHSIARSGTTTPAASWLRRTLVVAEVAMTVTLLVGAGLLVNSFLRLTSVDPGYNPRNLVQLTLLLPESSYPDGSQRAQFFQRLREEFTSLAGVEAASIVDGSLPGGGTITFGVMPQAEGQDAKQFPGIYISSVEVEPSFLRTLEIPLLAGRNFGADDTPESGNVIIDQDMARFFWGSESPIGRRFRLDADDPEPWLTVIGLLGDLKLAGQDDSDGALDFFRPLPRESLRNYMSVAVRTRRDPEDVMPAMRAVLQRLDPDLPLYRFATGETLLAESVDKPRFFLLMMLNFAAIALALALIGTYGVLAFAVRRRQRELGVRVALGAASGRLVAMVMREGLSLAGLGVLIGLAGALALGRVAAGLLFDLEPTDPATFVAVAALMLGCAALACWVPAYRASRVDPVEVLRTQ